MNIVITGASGMLGTELINQLQNTEHKIFALTSNKEVLIEKWNKNVQINTIEEWRNGEFSFKGKDVVIHCGFTRTSKGNDLAQSLAFTKDIFESAFIANCNTINISSRSVYGQNPNIPWTESTEICPDNLYALAKYGSELLLVNTFNKSSRNLKHTNIRLTGLLSVSFDDRIVNKLIDNIISGKAIDIVGGNQQFGFLDIKDAANAIITMINSKNNNWKLYYNLGVEKTSTILDIAKAIKYVSSKFSIPDVEINFTKSDAKLFAELDSNLFYSDFDWKPNIKLEATIENIFEFKLVN